MEGKMIYLLFRQDLQRGGVVLESPHATFDGAYGHIKAIREYFEGKDFEVKGFPDGSNYVTGPLGFKRMYYVSTRTIEK